MAFQLFQSLEEIHHFMVVNYLNKFVERKLNNGQILYIYYEDGEQRIAWVRYSTSRKRNQRGYYLSTH